MAATRTFRTLRRFLAPRWLTEGDGELVGYSLDIMKDAFVERARLGLLARMPDRAPADALPPMGRDRRVRRGKNESAASYTPRLLRWLDDRRTQGTAYAMMDRLAEHLGPLPMIRIVDSRGNWYTRAAGTAGAKSYLLNQANWNWDGIDPATWARFWVIIYPNGLWTEGASGWGDVDAPAWGANDVTWGSSASATDVAVVRGIVKEWKRAGSICVNVIIAFDAASFDPAAPEPDGTWGTWSKNSGGTQVAARLSTARYWDGS